MWCMYVCVSVCHVRGFCQKRINVSSNFFYHRVAKPFYFLHTNGMAILRWELSLTGAWNACVVGRSRDSEPISGFTACCQRFDQLGVINTHRRTVASCDTSLVVSGRVCLWRETTTKINVYDKKSERYAKDNKTAFNCTQ